MEAPFSRARRSGSSFSTSRRRVLTWGIVVFVVGLLVRLALVLTAPQTGLLEKPEPVRIALSLLETGKYADAYGVGSGPTAHCAPLYPLLLTILLRVFGAGAGGVRAIQILGSGMAALGFALLPALALAGELGLSTGVMAGLAGALLPINFWAQTTGAFEAPYTSVALVTLCLLVCRVWTTGRFSKFEASVLGGVAGFGCLLTPSLIPVLAAWSVVAIASYRRRLRQVAPFFGVAVAVAVSILAPWAIRNHNALGAFIWTRSNFGLELQISNNDAMTADGEHNVRMPEFAMFHPFASASELVKVREMGEVAYGRSKEQQAFAWIASHKRRFLSLTAERFRLFWLPHMRRPWQSTMEAGLTFSGMCGLVALWWKKRWFTWVVVPVFVGYSAVYYLIEASGRYRYPLEPILFLLAASFVAGIIRHIVAAVSSFNRGRDRVSVTTVVPIKPS